MPELPSLVVIMPAPNEEATIASVIGRIPRAIDGIAQVEVVIVDDGSTDSTAQLARDAGADVVSHVRNMGVGKAFATGIDAALKLGADIIVNMDSDGQFNPEDIPTLIRPILEEGYGFVTCTRFGKPEYIPQMPGIKKSGNRLMCHTVNRVISNAKFTDVSCGLRAYSRETALRLTLFGSFTYTQESFIDLASKGIHMTEVPLRVRGVREFGKSRVASNLWNYAFQTLPIIILAMRDTRPLAFFGILATFFFTVGSLLSGFVSLWFLFTGGTYPWTSLVTIGAACLIMSVLIGTIALIADQLGRVRKTQEELLLRARQEQYRKREHPVYSGYEDTFNRGKLRKTA